MIAFNVAAQYVKAETVTPKMYAYGGIAIEVIMVEMAAAFLGYATIYEVWNTPRRAYHTYQYKSSLGNWMGLYQVLTYLFGMIFPAIMAVSGYYIGADLMWKITEAADQAGEIDQLYGYRNMFLGFALGVSAWTAALAMTQTVNNLLPWYNSYNVASEATNSDGVTDSKGTSLTYDLLYHELTLLGTYMSVIGGIFLPTTVYTYLAL